MGNTNSQRRTALRTTATTTAALLVALSLATPAATAEPTRSKSTLSDQRCVTDAEGIERLESVPLDEVVSDSALFEAAKADLRVSGPGDYLLGRGFRNGFSANWRYGSRSPLFLYVVAEVKVAGADGEREVITALPWGSSSHLRIPPRLFKELIKTPGDYTVNATFHFFNVPGDELAKADLARLDGNRLRFTEPRPLSPDSAAKLLEAFEIKFPTHQLVSQNEVRAVADVHDYFNVIPPSPELDGKLRKSLEDNFISQASFPMFNPQALDCDILAHAEYQLKGDTKWRHLYDATFWGISYSCAGITAPIPPGTSELKLRFLPYSPDEAWAEKNNLREYYGGTIETGWLKLDSARGDEQAPAKPFK